MTRAPTVPVHFAPREATRSRTVLLNGSLDADPDVHLVEHACTEILTSIGIAVDVFRLCEVPVAYCQGCFECWAKHPGVCRTDDGARDVTRALIQADLAVFLTPVTFGGYSSELKKALDRSIGLVSPFFSRRGGEVHHRPRYARYPALLGVGVLPEARDEEERVFHDLVRRNALNLIVPEHESLVLYRSQGASRMRAALRSAVERLGFAA